MMAVIRHEMKHSLAKHVTKKVTLRVVYFNLVFLGFIFLAKYKEKWLPMFGISYDSLFLCMFILLHFIHYKSAEFVYLAIEHYFQRKWEFEAD